MSESDDDIITEAKKRFSDAYSFETTARNNYDKSLKMYFATSENGWAWADADRQSRIDTGRPCLTTNRVRIHCLQIINAGRQSKPAIKIRATGGGASYDSAQILEGLVREIENRGGQDAYDCAMFNQVAGNIGYVRLLAKYADDDSFSQDIFIERIANSKNVLLDHNIQMQDGSDAKWGFIFKDEPRDSNPEYKDMNGGATFDVDDNSNSWTTAEYIRVAEYYRIITVKDKLYASQDGTTIKRSQIVGEDGKPDKAAIKLVEQHATKTRNIDVKKLEWFTIVGNEITDRKELPGSIVPIVRFASEESIINGQLDRYSHISWLTDPTRMINLFNSNAVETLGYASKTQWLISAAALEGHKGQWDNSANETFPYMIYNDFDETGSREIHPAIRAPQPEYPEGYGQALKQAEQDLTFASGQEPASFGNSDVAERSGKAIDARVRESNKSTAHFVTRMSQAVRLVGRIIISWIPVYYDVQKTISILQMDGSPLMVGIDPSQPNAHSINPEFDENYSAQEIAEVLYNPLIGKYAVISDTSEDLPTRRMEGVKALSQIAQEIPEAWPVMADQVVSMMDIPDGDILIKRFRRMVPKQATGEGPSPADQQMQQALAQTNKTMNDLHQAYTELKSKTLVDLDQKKIDWFKAISERLAILGKIDPIGTMPLAREEISQELQSPVNPFIAAHAIENQILQQALGQIQPQGDQTANGGSPPMAPEQTDPNEVPINPNQQGQA